MKEKNTEVIVLEQKIVERKDRDAAYLWDLSHIFPTKEAWEAAYAETEKLIAALPALQGTLASSAEALKKALDLLHAAGEKVERVYLYANLYKSGDNGNPEAQDMEGRCIRLLMGYSTSIAFLEPELLSIPADVYRSYCEAPEMKTYRHLLEDTDRQRPHTLDAEKEKMLAMMADMAGGCANAFEMLESVDMTFPEITDEEGNKVTLTHGNFGVFRESGDQRVRKEAFEAYFGEFKKYINTFAATYSGSVKADCFFSSVRRYGSAREQALAGGNVPLDVYDSLISAVHDGLPTLKRYLALRKKVLGLDELNMYDLYCPMVAEVDMTVPFADAKTLVKNATKPLGEAYGKLLDRAFSERWIDVYENKGKTTGAFSCGVFGVHPYVLLNYTDTLDDAFTLAHELGHAMHSWFSDTTQDYPNHDYRIMVAEVASTVNEVLLTRYLLSTETDKSRRAYILNHFLEGFRTTIYRQTLFAEFEKTAHEMYERGETLTAEALNGVYRDLNLLYYDGATVNELQDIEWARIPHFYRPFYVYQYATGFSSAVAIADRILKTGDASDYLKFLTTGGSDYPLNELKIAGVDLTSPETVRSALAVFDGALAELEELLK